MLSRFIRVELLTGGCEAGKKPLTGTFVGENLIGESSCLLLLSKNCLASFNLSATFLDELLLRNESVANSGLLVETNEGAIGSKASAGCLIEGKVNVVAGGA